MVGRFGSVFLVNMADKLIGVVSDGPVLSTVFRAGDVRM